MPTAKKAPSFFSEATTMGKRKILIVDDSFTVRQTVSAAIQGSGFEIIEAEDGLDGLAKLEAHDDVALVFCDVNMPKMDGIEMIGLVRRMDKHAKLPLVMLTTEGQAELMAKAKAAGAKAWVVKPFEPKMLASLVSKIAGEAGG
jgi:two-component system, chemotaxis family, chemotaxis protein CheY